MRFCKIILSLILCICFIAGCGRNQGLTATDIADELKGLSSETVNWVPLDKSKISTYFGLSGDSISDFKAYINDAEVHFDIIAVFNFEDKDVRQEIINSINTMTTQMSESFKLVSASESTKINNHITATAKNTIILCIMDNPDKARKYLTDTVKAEIIS